MNVSEAKRLKALEAEKARLKKLLAETMLEQEATREPHGAGFAETPGISN